MVVCWDDEWAYTRDQIEWDEQLRYHPQNKDSSESSSAEYKGGDNDEHSSDEPIWVEMEGSRSRPLCGSLKEGSTAVKKAGREGEKKYETLTKRSAGNALACRHLLITLCVEHRCY